MKKIIAILGLLIVLALAGGVYYILTNLDAIVKAAIEKYGSEATHTAVRVDSLHIDFKNGSGQIAGLTVANPPGYDTKHAFSLGKIKTGIELKSIREQPYVISEITIDAPQVFAEVNADRKISLNELRKNLAGDKPKTESGKSDQAATEAPRLIIRRLSFTNGTLNAKVVPLNNKEFTTKLPNIQMADLGGSKGATPQELTREILKRLLDAAEQELKKTDAYAEVERLKAQAKEKVDEEKARLKEKADAKKEEEKQKLDEKFKKLLNKQ